MKQLLDSNIIIDLLLNRAQAIHWFEGANPKDIVICPINYAEVLTGCNTNLEWENAQLLMDEMHILNLELVDFISAAKIRQKYRLALPDALLASLAVRYKLEFLTRNTKDFNPSVHRFVKVPYKLH